MTDDDAIHSVEAIGRSSDFEPPNTPIVFAVMRNCHESLRSAMKELLEVHQSGSKEKTKEIALNLLRAIYFHTRMEDIDVFPWLNKQSADLTLAQKYVDEHQADDILTQRVAQAVNSDEDIPKELLDEWCAEFERHFTNEEKDLQPLTMKTGSTWKSRAHVFRVWVLTPTILREGIEEFSWFVGWNVDVLTRRGSTKNSPLTAARVFALGVQAGTTPEQWEAIKPIVRAHTTAEIWEHMALEYRIDEHPFR